MKILFIISSYIFFNTNNYIPVHSTNQILDIPTSKRIPIKKYENDFENYLTSISRNRNISVICEPIIAENTNDNIESRPKFGQYDPSSDEYLEIFCKFYGYKIIKSAPGILSLIKDYDNKNHIPNVTYNEIITSLYRLKKINQTFSSSKSFIQLISEFVNTLSNEQISSLKQGIHVDLLSEEQKDLLWSYCYSTQYIGFEDIDLLLQRLRGCKKPKTNFSFKPLFGESLPIYSGYFNPTDNSALYDVTLSRWIYTQSGGGIICDAAKAKLTKEGKISNIALDPTNPDFKHEFTSYSIGKTIGEFFDEGISHSKKKYILDNSIRNRRIIVIGNKESDFDNIILDFSNNQQLYIDSKDDITSINSLPNIDYNNIQNFKKNTLLSIPISLIKALNLEKVLSTSSKTPIDLNKELEISDNLYSSSIKRMREILEPKIKIAPIGKLPVKDSSNEIFDLLAISSISTLMPNLFQIITDIPGYLLNKEEFLESNLRIEFEEVPKTNNGDAGLRVNLHISSKKSGGFNVETIILRR